MDYDELAEKVYQLMQMTDSKFSKASGNIFALQSLTAPQVNVLLLLDRKGEMKISVVASELDMMDSNVSNICTRLEKAGFLYRNRLETDRRVVKIGLTEDAKLKMRDVKAAAHGFYSKMHSLINKKDWEDILCGLTKLNKLLDLYLENTRSVDIRPNN